MQPISAPTVMPGPSRKARRLAWLYSRGAPWQDWHVVETYLPSTYPWWMTYVYIYIYTYILRERESMMRHHSKCCHVKRILGQSAGVPYTYVYIYIYITNLSSTYTNLYIYIQRPRNLALRLSTLPWLMLRTWPMSRMATPTRGVLFCVGLPGYPMAFQKLPKKTGIFIIIFDQTFFSPKMKEEYMCKNGPFKNYGSPESWVSNLKLSDLGWFGGISVLGHFHIIYIYIYKSTPSFQGKNIYIYAKAQCFSFTAWALTS